MWVRALMAAATEADVARSIAFFDAWDLAPVRRAYDDGETWRPVVPRGDAISGLAQAFADDRAELEERLEACNRRLRETIGICSDIAKLMPQITEALDRYASYGSAVVACGKKYHARLRACGLPLFHTGPCGVTR